MTNTHRNAQNMRQLICLLLPQTVPSVRDEHNRNDELALGVHQLLESFLGCWDGGPAPHQDPINVKQQAEAWPRLFKENKHRLGLRGGSRM